MMRKKRILLPVVLCALAVISVALLVSCVDNTVPQPNTAMEEPNSGRSRLSTAPAPVWMPQPMGPIKARSTSSYSTLTALASFTTA